MYKLTASGVIRESDGVHIPQSTSNPDWAKYVEWRSAGGVPHPADVPKAPPATISRFQAKAVLHKHGLLDEVEAYATSPFADPLVKLAWYEATEVKRNSLMVMNIAILLDLNQSQLDNLFAEALTIEV